MARKRVARQPRGVDERPALSERMTKVFARLSDETKRTISRVRGAWNEYVNAFATMTARRVDLAAPIMEAFASAFKDNGGKLTFVDFLRVLDPSIPENRDDEDGKVGYRNHRGYQAGIYLQRLHLAAMRAEAGPRRQRRRINATQQLARVLATILPLVRDVDALWRGVKTEYQLDDEQIKRLRAATDAVQPLLKLPEGRKAPVRIIHWEAPAARNAAGEGRDEDRAVAA